jgi:hypothetical protein
MSVNKRQRIILVGVLEDEQRLANMPADDLGSMPRDQLGRHRLRVRHARAGLVPMNLAGWLGRVPTNSECVLFHREYLRLEALGLIERCNLRGGRRTSHLRLTPAGRRVAEDLLAEELGMDAEESTEPIDLASIEFLAIELPPGGDC